MTSIGRGCSPCGAFQLFLKVSISEIGLPFTFSLEFGLAVLFSLGFNSRLLSSVFSFRLLLLLFCFQDCFCFCYRLGFVVLCFRFRFCFYFLSFSDQLLLLLIFLFQFVLLLTSQTNLQSDLRLQCLLLGLQIYYLISSYLGVPIIGESK